MHRSRLAPKNSLPVARIRSPRQGMQPWAVAALMACGLASLSISGVSQAQTNAPVSLPAPPTAAASAPDSSKTAASALPVENSTMDAQLFYQVLVSELRLRQDDAGFAYQVYLESAKQHSSSQLFQRSVDIALAARAGEQALTAARAWRTALPAERPAAEYEAQILMALSRTGELASPLSAIVKLAPPEQRPQVIASLPRSLSRLPDRKAVALMIDEVTQPWRDATPPLAEAWAASSEGWLNAGDQAKAYERFQRAVALNPQLLTTGLLSLDLMTQHPEVEAIVKAQLAKDPSPVLRLAYARKLVSVQRMADAAVQLEGIVASQPDNAGAWLTLGSVRIELKQIDAAEQAIKQFLSLQTKQPTSSVPELAQSAFDPEQGYLRMAQISEMRKQWAQADEWLRKADPKGEKLTIQIARAKVLAVQGKVKEGRALIQALPEAEPRDALVKVNAEVQLLREANELNEAMKVLAAASERFPDDADVLYDQAMVAESLKRHDEAERLLKRVMTLQPDQANAFNALGYSLADRGIRLDEARELIKKALILRPGDPFITDSLGWVEFKTGNQDEAIKWLRQAYVSRADTEIAAHLGEVLWVKGLKDEALRIWREGLARDPANDTLKDTLKRLQVRL